MIVMKFGGSSLASPPAIRRVSQIVRDHLPHHPVLVVSALGDTTDSLAAALELAKRGECYLVSRVRQQLENYHLCLAEDLLSPSAFLKISEFIRQSFQDLHLTLLQLCEGERSFSPELQDWTLALGEQLSSRIVAAALSDCGTCAQHFDSRKLIVTDDQFTRATPRVWETYARIRWSLEHAARTAVPVLGGFIGSTEDGRTTTLGRGGSDLSASLIGAALNAEQIQFWKDVEGILTWNPKLKDAPLGIRHLTYSEAAELATAGAGVLHPDTIAPAQRLRIPVFVRNTFDPAAKGTAIDHDNSQTGGIVKCVVCQSGGTSPSGSSTMTLIGQDICRPSILRRIQACLASGDTIAPHAGTCSIQIVLGDPFSLLRCLERIRRTFFVDVDETIFSVSKQREQVQLQAVSRSAPVPYRRTIASLVLAH